MKVIGLIPARAGSQRLPRKNREILGNKPLIAWTIEAAKKDMLFDDIIVSSDDEEILAISKSYGLNVDVRPENLCRPETEMLDVVRYVANQYNFDLSDIVILLQPTSPFREAQDIVNSLGIMMQREADAVVSVTAPPNDLVFDIGHAGRLRPAKNIMVANGALYLITANHLRVGDWYTGLTYAYQMPKEKSLDIDTAMDLELARLMVKEQERA